MSKTETSPAIPAEKPLNQSQIKNLKELVEGDFKDLTWQVHEEIDRRLAKRLEEIDAKFSKTADLEEAQQRLREAARQAEDDLRALVAELTKGDLEVDTNGNYHRRSTNIVHVEVEPDLIVQRGRDEERNKATQAASRLKSTANRILNREQRTVNRVILLQGITPGSAQQILAEMPATEDVMTLLTSEIELVAGDDVNTLLTEADRENAKALKESNE